MPAPRPLTLCPPAQLDWSRPGTPAASDFGDIYFSTDGGLDETRTVFLEGCGLPDVWQNTERFVIGELGFGSGLNFLATWQLWEKTKPNNGSLHFVSIEKFPFDKNQLKQALSAWPELQEYAVKLIQQWPGRVKGFHRLHFKDVTLTLIHDDIHTALDDLDMSANAWFLDGFSPAKNPDMWSPDVMNKIAALSASGAKLSTFTVAGDVRRALQDAGFIVERKEGFGRKRHRLEAHLTGAFPKFSYGEKSTPTIIGAGIAGLSLAQALLRRGIKPVLIEDPHHIAASGNAAALVKPRLDLQDRPESRFFLGSYLYALNTYHDAAMSKGIKQIPKNDTDRKRHEKLLLQEPLPTAHLDSAKNDALLFPQALVIDPIKYKDSVLPKVNLTSEILTSLEMLENISLFLAAGFGIKTLLPDWPMRFSRGQISWGYSQETLGKAISYGGYAIAVGNSVLVGATHNRLNPQEDPFAVKAEDDKKNLTQFGQFIGDIIPDKNNASRASIRVTSSDTLPVIGQTEEGHYVLTGLGSRGFVFAPLLAEAIVSHYYGDPMPIAKSVWQRFSVTRLLN